MASDTQQLIIALKTRGVKLTSGQLKQLNGTVKSSKMAMVGMTAAIAAAVIAIAAMAKVIGHSIRVGKEFEKSIQNLKAISGATSGEINRLSLEARKLGASTKYTASEVAGLQLEFAKLGFKTDEIQNATKATLSLASAIGADLAQAAAVTGQNVRAFGLDTKETSRVADVMAKSFSRSALDLQKFTDSMTYVAPVAKMAGFEIEGTTAIIGTLANAGISGSMAGTALRRIFLELSNESSKLSKRLGGPISSVEELIPALEKLKEEGIGTAEMKDLVGQRAISAFSILLDGTETVDNLTESLENAGGAAETMAEIQLDSLDGKLTILNSAWEGFGIALFDHFDEPLKTATKTMTKWLQTMTKAMETGYSGILMKERIELNALAVSLKKNIENEESRTKILNKINTMYPGFLDNMKSEHVTIGLIDEALKQANHSYQQRIAIAVKEDLLKESMENSKDAMKDMIDIQLKMDGVLFDVGNSTGVATDINASYEEQVKAQIDAISKLYEMENDSVEGRQKLAEINEASGKSYKSIGAAATDLTWKLKEVDGAFESGMEAITAYSTTGIIPFAQLGVAAEIWAQGGLQDNLSKFNDLSKEHQEELIRQEKYQKQLNETLKKYGLDLDDIPKEVITTVTTIYVEQGAMGPLPEGTQYEVSADVKEPDVSGISGAYVISPEALESQIKYQKQQAIIAEKNEKFSNEFLDFEIKKIEGFNKTAQNLAFEMEFRGKVSEVTRQQSEELSNLMQGGMDQNEALKKVFGTTLDCIGAEDTLASRRLDYNESRLEQFEQQAEGMAFQLEAQGDITEATEEQVEQMAVLLEAGKTMAEALKEVFDYEEPINPFISPEQAQTLMDNLLEIENEYNSTRLEQNLATQDQRRQDTEDYQTQLYEEGLISKEAYEKELARIQSVYEKKKKDLSFQSFSAGINMMSQNLNAAAEAGIVSQKTAKAASAVNTVIKTYESAVNAYNSVVGIPIVGPGLAVAAAAAAIAAGMGQLQAIKGTSEEKTEAPSMEKYLAAGKAAAKAQKGGLIGGKPHALGGTMIEAERGEFIIRKNIVDRVGADALHQLNTEPVAEEPGETNLNITFQGNIMSREFVEDEVIEVLQDFVRRGGEI